MNAVSCVSARLIDEEAVRDRGETEKALIDRAGALCARILEERDERPVAVVAGPGNNAEDAYRAAELLLKSGAWKPEDLTVVLRSSKEAAAGPGSRLRLLLDAGARTCVWDGPEGRAAAALRGSRLVVDALAGTGLSGPARGPAAEIIAFLNGKLRGDGARRVVASIDLPSGLSDESRPGDPVVRADLTIAVEPIKACLYRPFARASAGRIRPALGVFPRDLAESRSAARVLDFAGAAARIPPVPADAYKHRRGLAEIRAGSVGGSGAAKLAARGAAAAGAGLIRLVADAEIWSVLAAGENGAMVIPEGSEGGRAAAPADAYLLGPGWGAGAGREETLRRLLEKDAAFVLDADALALLPPKLPPSAILTPHPGEFARLSGCSKAELEADPDPILRECARTLGAAIVLKGHVVRIAAADGRLEYVDGMEPVLATGGSGDVLAGLAAGLSARERRRAAESAIPYDPFPAAVAAAALLVEAGGAARREFGFCDAAAFAGFAARIAGAAWLPEY